jgi:DNA-binding NtrC family response regulator
MKNNPEQVQNKEELIGNSSSILALKEKIANLRELDIPVYIQGDAGTGKDLIARLIAGKKILQVDCANFSSDWNLLIQNYANKTAKTLHIRGEIIKVTDPLYFDKLEFLDTEGQAILFRILDNQEFVTSKKETVEFSSRIFLSSNKNLPQLVKDGLFRKDLFQKINLICLNTVSLREIKSDLPLLVNHFVTEFKTKYKKNIQRLSEKLIQFILQYDWPGNVAQLRSMLEGMIILSSEKILDISQVPKDFIAVSSITSGGKLNIIPGIPMDEYEKEIIRENLKSVAGNRDKCAKLLGISERTLYRKLKEYNLE